MRIRLFTIPNMITLLNLLSGCVAVYYAFMGELEIAFWLIVAAAVFDFLDGFAARMLKQYSEVGKQLDSLADMVSFGFAPAVILFALAGYGEHGWWDFGTFLLAAFSALRLAKFNVDETQTEEFRGLPTPACALLVASAGYWLVGQGIDYRWVMVCTVILCALLVSDIRMFSLKFKTWGLGANALRYGFLLASAVAIAVWGVPAVTLVFVGYILTSMVRNLVCRKA